MLQAEGTRVLVIDSNTHIRRLMRTVMGALEIEDVVGAASPAQAVPLMQNGGFGLVLIEWTGDAGEFRSFVGRVRAGEFGVADVPVLALVGSAQRAEAAMAWECGVDDVVAKPISAFDVVRRIETVLQKRQGLDMALAG